MLDGTLDLVCDIEAGSFDSGIDALSHSGLEPFSVARVLLLEPGEPFLRAVRHVLNAPVRAGLVKHAADWQWSSFLSMADSGRFRGLVDAQAVLQHLRGRGSASLQRFARFVIDGEKAPDILDEADTDNLLGSRNWRARIRRSQQPEAGFDGEAPARRRPGRPPRPRNTDGPTLADYEEAHPGDTHAAIRAAFATGRFTQREIGDHFNLRQGSISRIVNLPATKRGRATTAAAEGSGDDTVPAGPKARSAKASGTSSWPVVSAEEAEEALRGGFGGTDDEDEDELLAEGDDAGEDMLADDGDLDEDSGEGDPDGDGPEGAPTGRRAREPSSKWWQKRAMRRSAARRR